MLGGMLSLLCWNSLLNLTNYFNHTISKDIYTYITWSFCFGGILSFILSPVMFYSIQNKKSLYLSLFLTFFTFLSVLLICNSYWVDLGIKKFLVIQGIFVMGFFSSFFQSKVFSIAASFSAMEIRFFNLGSGVMGFLSNVIYYLISIYYKSDTKDKEI